MNIFGIGLPELAVIAAIGLLVFGPKRLPELGKTLGRTLRGFQSASQEFEQEFRSAIGTDTAAASGSQDSPSRATADAPVALAASTDPVTTLASAHPDGPLLEAVPVEEESVVVEAGSGPA